VLAYEITLLPGTVGPVSDFLDLRLTGKCELLYDRLMSARVRGVWLHVALNALHSAVHEMKSRVYLRQG
jgi:hypothetical protein